MSKLNTDTHYKFITWNIDGLDEKNIKERTLAVIACVQSKRIDIVFLQEVVDKTYDLLNTHLSTDYYLTENKSKLSREQWYFTVILLKKTTFQHVRNIDPIPFSNSTMGRDLTIVETKFSNGVKLALINTHLEYK